MVGIDRAWNQPIRRIYLVWGVVLLIGFILTAYGFQDGWLHWYPLSVIGILSQIIKQRLTDNRAKLLLGMWAIISFGGTYYSHQLMMGGFEFPKAFNSFAMFWLSLMSIPQIITGVIMKSLLQKVLGGVWAVLGFGWIILSIIGSNPLIDEMYLAILAGLISGLPYLYIAFKK